MSAQLDVIGLSPPGFASEAVALAAHRAGAIGGVALEHCTAAEVGSVVARLAALDGRFVVSADLPAADLAPLLEPAHGWVQRIIYCRAETTELAKDIASLREVAGQVWVQVTSLAEAVRAESCGADGVVVKGNEAGGRIGEETTFILLQRIMPKVGIKVWARGGVGVHSAAACLAAGAAGVVLDWQLALCEESALPDEVKTRIARMDGSETAVLGQQCPLRYRAYFRPGEQAFTYLKEWEEQKGLDADAGADALLAWRDEVQRRIRGESAEGRLLLIGQDAAFAPRLAAEFRTVGGVCEAIRRSAAEQCQSAARHRALRPEGPLARSHGTPFPVLQGPMTRVSDTADFADAVAAGGGLPFLALALLRGPRVAELLEETKERLGDRSWGIGILGFVPKELREEQLAEVEKHPPRFAIIAGGRPDQAAALERKGIRTYLHVPSPGLLEMFLRNGARRVIFEGRECGGHVGPRTSFVLWESMIRVILDHLEQNGGSASDYHVVFAGGIHDAASASMVASMAAPLGDRGVRIGVLLGTSYLFTEEAVATGAITKGFQEEALRCEQTILLESGVGHATRCADTAFGRYFTEEKRRLIAEGRSKEEIREALEMLNLGRLRIASKGIVRGGTDPRRPAGGKYVKVDDETQHREGMYMIGQVAALRDKVCTIRELHEDVSAGGVERLERFAEASRVRVEPHDPSGPCDVAIVGMSCLFPQADGLGRYWDNIVNKVNTIREVPPERWDSGQYFDPDRRARDKIYSKWGGFLDDVAFDPLRYGMPPNSLPSVEPLHLLVLEAVRRALEDAGYAEREFDRQHTSVVLGAGGGVADLGLGYGFRSLLPFYLRQAGISDSESQALMDRLDETLPEWTEDSFAGLLLNVAAGRVANRFDLGGTNFTVDAACASSLAAVRLAVQELESGSSNMVIVGGADTMQSPFAYLCFSKTQALSPTGQCRTFDQAGDGIVISEGIAIAVLKRLRDAQRDGDRIYAVIKGIGSSSDGRDKGLTAPRPAGQIRALERAYAKAGFSPATVGLIEAHGTGTIVGDQSEVESLTTMFTREGAALGNCALGSVKSMIGHTKCTAGVAGLIKAALALHHKVLPPTLGVSKPNARARFHESPFHVNTETRPWIGRGDGTPRRAGVSAFGFGGTNFHAVLEEYAAPQANRAAAPGVEVWPSELFVFRAGTPAELVASVERITTAINEGARPALRDLAAAVGIENEECRIQKETRDLAGGKGEGRVRPLTHHCCLAVVASSLDDLVQKLGDARSAVTRDDTSICDPRGVYYAAEVRPAAGSVAFVFPGQGSQSVNMLRDLAVAFPAAREAFEVADRVLGADGASGDTPCADVLGRPLSGFIFPPPRFADEERAGDMAALTQTRVAQPAMGAADLAMLRVLESLGVRGDFGLGHSFGEYVALCAAGVIEPEDMLRLAEARGRLIAEAGAQNPGTMAAVKADEATARRVVADADGVTVANLNGPSQTVISGSVAAVDSAIKRFSEAGIAAVRIAVSCAFHSPLVAGAKEPFSRILEDVAFSPARFPVYSNTTGLPHVSDAVALRGLLVRHLVEPVRFVDQVRAMYDMGARVFVEVGPGRTLSNLIGQILEGRPFAAVAMDQPGKHGLTQLCHGLAQLATCGVSFSTEVLFAGRVSARLGLERLAAQSRPAPLSPTTWMVNGARAVPLNGKIKRISTGKPAGKPDRKKAVTPEDAFRAARTDAAPKAPAVKMPSMPAASGPAASEGRLEAGAAGGADPVMTAYHELMGKFLDTQRNVMLAYLQGSDGPSEGRIPAAARTDGPAAEPEADVPARPAAAERRADVAVPSEERVVADSPTAASEEAAPALTREKLAERLTAVVGDRTGYPPEMLGLDMDLEADLGIDSIKRVEILGALQDDALLSGEAADGDMEELAKLKTLRAIVDWVIQRRSRDGAAEVAGAGKTDDGRRGAGEDAQREETIVSAVGLPRMLVEAVECPAGDSDNELALSGLVIVTNDGLGAGAGLVSEIQGRGGTPVLVGTGAAENGSETCRNVELADSEAVRRLVSELRQAHGPVAGIVHAAPLANAGLGAALDAAGWQRAVEPEVHALFNLLQAAEQDLRSSGGFVVAATALGGDFASAARGGSGRNDAAFWPGSGGVCGLVKAVAREWSEVHCKAVDFAAGTPAEAVARAVLGEVHRRDGLNEVGYADGRRITLVPQEAALTEGEADDVQLTLSRDSVVLVTGGARGITAEVALELARRFGCKLVLVGRSAIPDGEEPTETRGQDDPKALKSLLMKRLDGTGRKATPAIVEGEYRRVLRDREIRSNLSAMREAGSEVAYYTVDVTDSEAFGGLIDEVYARFGRIDGVIHGAGVIEDKFIADKTVDSFTRVLRPKVSAALTLASKLKSESLKFLVFFSSVTARYGNRGQCDYAAANEVLNKLAHWLNARWPGRVVALNWGPWKTAGGMVSEELAKQFAKAGVAMVAPEAGRRAFLDELLFGVKGDAEVLFGGPMLGSAAMPLPTGLRTRLPADGAAKGRDEWAGALPIQGSQSPAGPLLATRAQVRRPAEDRVEIIREIDPAHDLFLLDHQLDGKPVMPMAMALELIAETCVFGWPDLHLTAVRELRVLRGVVLDNGPRTIHVLAEGVRAGGGLDVRIRAQSNGSHPVLHYTAEAELRRQPAAAPQRGPWRPSAGRRPGMTLDEVYDKWLFHGPLFAGITEISSLGEEGITGRIAPSSPKRLLAESPEADWLIDPVVLDSALQLAIVWCRHQLDATPLPARVGQIAWYGVPAGGEVICEVQVTPRGRGPAIHCDITFRRADDSLIGYIRDFEGTCSRALNRLAGVRDHSAGAHT